MKYSEFRKMYCFDVAKAIFEAHHGYKAVSTYPQRESYAYMASLRGPDDTDDQVSWAHKRLFTGFLRAGGVQDTPAIVNIRSFESLLSVQEGDVRLQDGIIPRLAKEAKRGGLAHWREHTTSGLFSLRILGKEIGSMADNLIYLLEGVRNLNDSTEEMNTLNKKLLDIKKLIPHGYTKDSL